MNIMSERKKTPDVLADLLGHASTPTETILPASQQNVETAEPQAVKTVKPLASKTVKQQNGKTAIDDSDSSETPAIGKVKVTFYLSEDALEQLEDAQRTLRRLARAGAVRGTKSATSKSAVLEEALKMACEELEKQGEKSALARALF